MPVVTKRKQREYKLSDINDREFELLRLAYFLPDGKFVCFGKHFHKLNKLELIDDECGITIHGRNFCKFMMWKIDSIEAKISRNH